MHRLSTSVLMLIILPLACSCESGLNKSKIAEDYRNIIQTQLKHAEDSIERLNSNCTIRNVNMSKEPVNAKNILKKICRVNGKLKRFGCESDNVHGDLKDFLDKVVEEISMSLRCWSHQKTDKTMHPIRKWKPCKVKGILSKLQRYFEQYNAQHS